MLRVLIWSCVLVLGLCKSSRQIKKHHARDQEYENIKSIIINVDAQLRNLVTTTRSKTDETIESAKEVEEAEKDNVEALKEVKAEKEKEYAYRMKAILGRLKQETKSFHKGRSTSAASRRSGVVNGGGCKRCKCSDVKGTKRLCVNSNGCCDCCCQHCCFCCECEPCYHHHHRYGPLCFHHHVWDNDTTSKDKKKIKKKKIKASAADAKTHKAGSDVKTEKETKKTGDKTTGAEKPVVKEGGGKSATTNKVKYSAEKEAPGKDVEKFATLENLMNTLLAEKEAEGEKSTKRCKCTGTKGITSKRCKCASKDTS